MGDFIDRVQAQEAMFTQSAIEARKKFSNLPSRINCEDCEDPIPEQRRAMGGVRYCIDCQQWHEKQKVR